MPLPTKSLDTIVRRAIAGFRTSFRGWPAGSKQFFGRSARAIGLPVWGLQKSIEDLDRDIVPSPNSSDDTLTAWADRLGLPNGVGGYGRKQPSLASGGAATLTGVKGTVYPDGAIATAEDGTTEIELTVEGGGNLTISGSPPGFGSVDGSFVAVTRGTGGNLPAGAVMTWQNPPDGADTTFVLTSPLGGAVDTEDNASVYVGIAGRLQNPRRGGANPDYVFWAESVAGVYRAYVYALRDGTGTVDVIIVAAGTGAARSSAAAGFIAAVVAAIRAARPTAVDGIRVLIPATDTGHLVRVRLTAPASKYAYDWDDRAATYTVDAYTVGPPATIRLPALAPTSLKGAIDDFKNGLGLAPRLQVISTGTVINLPIRVVDYVDGGGKTTLTLESLPSGWVAPTAGDAVYAYGPIVPTVAAGIAALCDSLGPSRASGYGDDQAPWLDTLTLSGISSVAETAIDADGTKLIGEVLGGGVTVDGAASDVQGVDNGTDAPELLFLRGIAVTQ